MTIDGPRGAIPQTIEVDERRVASDLGLELDAADAARFEPVATDSIGLSADAAARLNGGARVRAFVLEGMDDARATVDLGENRSLVLDHGLYGLF